LVNKFTLLTGFTIFTAHAIIHSPSSPRLSYSIILRRCFFPQKTIVISCPSLTIADAESSFYYDFKLILLFDKSLAIAFIVIWFFCERMAMSRKRERSLFVSSSRTVVELVSANNSYRFSFFSVFSASHPLYLHLIKL
jgi:hypothetical protein